MKALKGYRWARGVGLLLGLSVAVIAILGWRIPPGAGTLGTDLIIASGPTGELAVTPAGPFVSATGMRPAAEADAPSWTLKLKNLTGSTLDVRVKGLPSMKDLDGLLWVEIDAAGSQLFRGPVGLLREWTQKAFTLRPGEATTLSVKIWLPVTVTSGYEGRIATVDLTYQSTPVGA